MAVTAKFIADFTSFHGAVEKAKLDLRSFETSSSQVEKQLGRMADSFSGRRILSEATLATEAVSRIGGASKLTSAEQNRVNAMVTEAITKYRALGQQAPADMLALERATRRVKEAQQDFGTTIVNTSEFFQERTRQSADNLGLLGMAARSLGPVIAGAFTIQKVTQFIGGTIEAGNRLKDLQERTGLGVASLQEFDVIASKSGTSLESLVKNAEQLGIRLNKGDISAVKGVKDLGLHLDALIAMRPEDRFTAVMEALGGIDDEARRATIGVALMGRGFTEVAAAANGSFVQMRESARANIAVLSDSQVKALASLDDGWKHFTGRISRGVQITGAEIVKAFTLRSGFWDQALGTSDLEAVHGRIRQMTQESAAEIAKLVAVTSPPAGGVEAYTALSAAVAAAHREFRALSDADEQRIRNSILLGRAVKELSEDYGISERAIQFVIEKGKLDADQKAILAKKTDELRKAEERLNEQRQKQIAGARADLFGDDAIERARLYVQAVGDVTRVTDLSGDAQARLAETMRAGLDALILQGRATDDLTGVFEQFRLKATETSRDAAAAYQLQQSQAALAADMDREMARALEENRIAIEQTIRASTALATTQGPQLEMLAGRWHSYGIAAATAIKLAVPPGFSFEQAFKDAGFIIHNPLSGLRPLRPMASGGIVTRPTAALIGERGPEVVVPLTGGRGLAGGITVNIDARDSMFDTPASVQRMADRVGHVIVSRLISSGGMVR